MTTASPTLVSVSSTTVAVPLVITGSRTEQDSAPSEVELLRNVVLCNVHLVVTVVVTGVVVVVLVLVS